MFGHIVQIRTKYGTLGAIALPCLSNIWSRFLPSLGSVRVLIMRGWQTFEKRGLLFTLTHPNTVVVTVLFVGCSLGPYGSPAGSCTYIQCYILSTCTHMFSLCLQLSLRTTVTARVLSAMYCHTYVHSLPPTLPTCTTVTARVLSTMYCHTHVQSLPPTLPAYDSHSESTQCNVLSYICSLIASNSPYVYDSHSESTQCRMMSQKVVGRETFYHHQKPVSADVFYSTSHIMKAAKQMGDFPLGSTPSPIL